MEKLENDAQLHVWIEPEERRDEDAIVQLDINAASYVGDSEVSPQRAVSDAESACKPDRATFAFDETLHGPHRDFTLDYCQVKPHASRDPAESRGCT